MTGNSLTAIFGSILGAAPLFMPFIPPTYAALASVLLQSANAVYHLYVPTPSATAPASK